MLSTSLSWLLHIDSCKTFSISTCDIPKDEKIAEAASLASSLKALIGLAPKTKATSLVMAYFQYQLNQLRDQRLFYI